RQHARKAASSALSCQRTPLFFPSSSLALTSPDCTRHHRPRHCRPRAKSELSSVPFSNYFHPQPPYPLAKPTEPFPSFSDPCSDRDMPSPPRPPSSPTPHVAKPPRASSS